jgi:hypothetical protein
MIYIFIMFPVKLIIRLLHGIMKVCFLDAIWYLDSRILIWRTFSLSCRNIWSIRTARAKDADDFRIRGMTALFDCIRVESQILTQGPIPAFRVMKWPATTLKTALIWYRFLRCAPFLFVWLDHLFWYSQIARHWLGSTACPKRWLPKATVRRSLNLSQHDLLVLIDYGCKVSTDTENGITKIWELHTMVFSRFVWSYHPSPLVL